MHRKISGVGEKVTLIEVTTQLEQSRNAFFESQLRNHETNPFVGWNPASKAIHVYQLSQVAIDGQFRGLLNQQGVINGTGYLSPDSVLGEMQLTDGPLIPTKGGARIVVGCNAAYTNYFHWITQALPTINFALEQKNRICPVLALPVLNKWQKESLDCLCHADIQSVTIRHDKQFIFDKIDFNEILVGGSAFCLSKIAARTYARLRSVVNTGSSGRKLYVARTDAPRRQMRNEGTLIRELKQMGFEIIIPGDYSFIQQIQLFREASLVVGPHGAGMTNIIFCDPGVVVYELLPDSYHNACFCNLAHTCGLRYWVDVFKNNVGECSPDARKWDADIEFILERLSEIEALAHTKL